MVTLVVCPKIYPLLIWQAHATRLLEMRAMREYEEMRECTFTPEVNMPVLITKVS